MNPLIDFLNAGGERLLRLAWPMFWQSSLLIVAVFLLDYAFRKKIRASIRYLLWLVVLVKLVLPPSLASPTGVAWWLRSSAPPPPAAVQPPMRIIAVPSANAAIIPRFPIEPQPAPALPPAPEPSLMTTAAWMLSAWSLMAVMFFFWLTARWRRVGRQVRQATPAAGFDGRSCLADLFDEAKRRIGVKRAVRLRVMPQSISPAVYGLFRPVILLPQMLADRLSPTQLRPVLLHELIHLRRRDVWVNCAQTLLQIVFWWHPLLWFANAQIRRVREEAVDDAVMLALRGEADVYAPTLLEVAKVAFQRPRAGLALIGILESRSALAHRIDRLVNFKPPRRAGLSLVSLVGIVAFTAVAVPMGEGPAKPEPPAARAADHPLIRTPATDSRSDVRFTATELAVATNDTVDVALTKDGSYWMGTNSLNLHQVRQAFTEAKKRAGANGRSLQIRIQADSEASYSSVVSLIDLSHELGLSGVSVEKLHKNNRETSGDSALIWTGKTRQQLIRKLDQIRLDRIAYDQVPLSDVLRDLSERVRRISPDNNDLRFLVDPNPPAGSAEKTDVRSVPITFPELKDVRVADVLDAIAKSASVRIRYSFHDDAIVFSLAPPPGPELYMRTFKVDPEAFNRAIQNLGSDSPDRIGALPAVTTEAGPVLTTPAVAVHDAGEGGIKAVLQPASAEPASVINFFLKIGVDLRPETGKNLFWGGLTGVERLMVRATTEDLDRIESALKALETTAEPYPIAEQHPNPLATQLPPRESRAENHAPASPTNLFIRKFKVDPNLFYQALESATPGSSGTSQGLVLPTTATGDSGSVPRVTVNEQSNGGLRFITRTNSMTPVQAALIPFFLAVGVDLRPETGKNIFFGDRNGTLFVRATARDLDIIEATIQTLNTSPPQIQLTVRMIEVPEQISNEVWAKQTIITNASTWTAALRPEEARDLLRWLEARNDSSILMDGRVTTLSDRQAQLQVVDLIQIVGMNGQSPPSTNPVPIGPTIDITPSINADGRTIQMTIIPTMVEFLGYDDPGPFVVQQQQAPDGNHLPLTAVLPLPHFRVRQITVNAAIRDGHTILLGGHTILLGGHTILLGQLAATNVIRLKEKVPVLGDLPVVGRFFRSEKNGTETKNILVFITPTIVDPAGNRVHPEETARAKKN